MRNNRSKTVSSFFGSVEKRVKRLDAFGESYRMKLDLETRDKEVLQTLVGSFVTLLIIFAVGAYALQKIDVWINTLEEYIMHST